MAALPRLTARKIFANGLGVRECYQSVEQRYRRLFGNGVAHQSATVPSGRTLEAVIG